MATFIVAPLLVLRTTWGDAPSYDVTDLQSFVTLPSGRFVFNKIDLRSVFFKWQILPPRGRRYSPLPSITPFIKKLIYFTKRIPKESSPGRGAGYCRGEGVLFTEYHYK